MKPSPQTTARSHTPLLISLNSASHVHLIIGSNPLAAARCTKSAEAGAKPIVITPADAEVHYTLSKRFEEGTAQWVQKNYEDEDLKTLGRAEVDGVVDAVFVTLGRRHLLSEEMLKRVSFCLADNDVRCTYLYDMSKTSNTGQCSGCPKSLHIHYPLHTFGWPVTCGHNHFRPRM
jgi:hypothetical protein